MAVLCLKKCCSFTCTVKIKLWTFLFGTEYVLMQVTEANVLIGLYLG